MICKVSSLALTDYWDCFPPTHTHTRKPCREIENGVPRLRGTPGSGLPNADILLTVDADAGDICEKGLLGLGTVCQLDSLLSRPVMGYINLCSRAILSDSAINKTAYSVILHEIAHSLGFLSGLYAFMRDENGEPRTRRNPFTQMPDLGIDSNGAYIPDEETVDTVYRSWKSVKGKFIRETKILKTPMLLVSHQLI
ncbi:hypothetical protein P879_10152 [Paragonimus westermani]|uniref:Leishmanolysin-like peptidase n=1 Tax=Paragonimus westermani TaxID=34504 RepID=A0A8T0DC41_9TREM|nr:hypothetical protein P879_10152 [Paragonimus westermani]